MWGTVPEILSETHIVILSHFCPFIPLTTRKIKILKKWKMYLEMSSFYRCVIKITVIWCMLSKIWSATDKIFCHFEPFFANLSHSQPEKSKFSKNEKKRLFSEIWSDRQAEFFSHFGPFSSLLPTALSHPLQSYNIPKKQNLKKWETPGDIIILYKCTKIMIICYTVPKIWRVTDVIVIFHFRLFLGAPPKKYFKP